MIQKCVQKEKNMKGNKSLPDDKCKGNKTIKGKLVSGHKSQTAPIGVSNSVNCPDLKTQVKLINF